MATPKTYAPDNFKPLIPGPPPVNRNLEQDRRNMRQYAQQRYLEARRGDTDYD